MPSTPNLEDAYMSMFKELLGSSDVLALDDVEFLGQYLVMRFIKTSPDVAAFGHNSRQTREGLREYFKTIYPFLVAFIVSANFFNPEEPRA
jgi:hypothetical protein